MNRAGLAYFTNPEERPPQLRRFEDGRVRMALERFHLLRLLAPMLDRCHEMYGVKCLTFAGLREALPTFPILLEARYHSRVAEHCPPARMFKAFERVFLYDSYLEVFSRFAQEANGRPIGMVVPFDGYRGGMVVHNGAFDAGSAVLVYRVPGGRPPHQLTVEPYDRELKYLAATGWTPEAHQPAKLPARRPAPERVLAIEPWMVRRLGPGPALVVLGWLRSVLASPAADDLHLIRRLAGGRRGVAAERGHIARRTGLSEAQTKRALAALTDARLIEPRGPGGNGPIVLAAGAIGHSPTDDSDVER